MTKEKTFRSVKQIRKEYFPKAVAKEEAKEHWEWLSSLLKKIYIDAFIHGHKHGTEDVQ